MSALAILNMIFIITIVVGGFIYFGRMASGREKTKQHDRAENKEE